MKFIPSKKQWRSWSLPNRLTAIGAYAGVAALILGVIFYTFTRGTSNKHNTVQISAITSGPFSPAITKLDSDGDVTVKYSFKSSELARYAPRYELYFQKMKSPPDPNRSEQFYEIGFKNITDAPLLNFEFAIYFESPVDIVQYEFNRSSANMTGGDYLSSDKKRFHWFGNQIMEDGGWAVFRIETKQPPPVITRVCTKIPGVIITQNKLILPDPEGLKDKNWQKTPDTSGGQKQPPPQG